MGNTSPNTNLEPPPVKIQPLFYNNEIDQHLNYSPTYYFTGRVESIEELKPNKVILNFIDDRVKAISFIIRTNHFNKMKELITRLDLKNKYYKYTYIREMVISKISFISDKLTKEYGSNFNNSLTTTPIELITNTMNKSFTDDIHSIKNDYFYGNRIIEINEIDDYHNKCGEISHINGYDLFLFITTGNGNNKTSYILPRGNSSKYIELYNKYMIKGKKCQFKYIRVNYDSFFISINSNNYRHTTLAIITDICDVDKKVNFINNGKYTIIEGLLLNIENENILYKDYIEIIFKNYKDKYRYIILKKYKKYLIIGNSYIFQYELDKSMENICIITNVEAERQNEIDT